MASAVFRVLACYSTCRNLSRLIRFVAGSKDILSDVVPCGSEGSIPKAENETRSSQEVVLSGLEQKSKLSSAIYRRNGDASNVLMIVTPNYEHR